jgi:hypothetical protein
MTMLKRIASLACAFAAVACSDAGGADGKGTVTFRAWGEEYIEDEIPAKDESGNTVVEDGWTIAYDRFLIVLSDVSVAEDGAAPVARMTTPKIVDLRAPGEKLVVAFDDVPGKSYTHVSYAISPATAAAELAGGATDADRQLMVTNGYSVFVSGTARKGTLVKKYDWGFGTSTVYDRCKGEVSGKETDGVVVTNGGNDVVQLTIHGDHLYYDDLQSPAAKIRFDNLAAADANDDGIITLEELAAVKLADRTKVKEGPYGTGSASGIHDLRAFVEALSRTLGHFRGEGECLARAR